MVVSSSPYEHMIGKPNVKYVANMHGNEAVGRELMLHLILYLVQNYDSDYYVRWLLDNTRIHIMPSMNPDGFEVREQSAEGGELFLWFRLPARGPVREVRADTTPGASTSTGTSLTISSRTTRGPSQRRRQ